MNAEDFIVSFKRDMAALSRTERLRAIESDETFLAVSGRGSLSSKRAMDVLRGRVEAGSVVATDKAPACSRSSAWRRTRPTTPRTAPRARSTG